MITKPRLTVKFVEILDLMERNIVGSEYEGAKTVELNTVAARIMLDLARCAPRTNTGQQKPRRVKLTEKLIFEKAVKQRAAMVAGGMPRGEATRKAVAMVMEELPHLGSSKAITNRLSAESSRLRKSGRLP
jgi:hypothetical protein